MPAVDREGVEAAAALIRPYVRETPVLAARGADFGLPDVDLFFKLESLQRSGSFKARGAFASLLMREVPRAGVVAASGGNHGAAVAYAAQRLGVPASIYVPTVSSPAKIQRIRDYGARLVVTGDRYADALAASETYAAESGAMRIHAYDQPETLLGQATIGLELERQTDGIDTLLVAVGGGGLIGGIAAWFAGRVKIVGVEPEGAPTLTTALRAGRPVNADAGSIAADSLAPQRVGELMFPIAREHVAQVVLVTDDHIREAQRKLWNVLRIVAEPGGAAAFAALIGGAYRLGAGERVAVVVCGANTDAVKFD
ncbi:MAG TPA: threonine/serine dehydratase [Thermoanaerobaculia bacterium]|jgi:threonine dehydratase|nr:threonine/serine dehydratase [Thermoanaerobaculia bacterium]